MASLWIGFVFLCVCNYPCPHTQSSPCSLWRRAHHSRLCED
jgi:hypothetical protein